jgi:acyl-coenzyme A synthetase/AMP-(fatty) acid ligase
MRAIPSAQVSNVYGPAEVNQCTYHHLADPPPPDAPVPIGRAWSGARIALVADGNVVAGAGAGELWVATDTMMAHYWNRPDLTSRSILHDPAVPGPGRWYRTGDLVERRADGDLVFLGRIDNQIKLRGYRIELEAVEAAIVESTAVDGCAAVVDADGESIVAIVDPVLDDITLDGLRESARRRLPRHAVPTRIVPVPELPRTSTGKVDRGAARRLLHHLGEPGDSAAGHDPGAERR